MEAAFAIPQSGRGEQPKARASRSRVTAGSSSNTKKQPSSVPDIDGAPLSDSGGGSVDEECFDEAADVLIDVIQKLTAAAKRKLADIEAQ